jgi:CPA2 family monovalent cation:H+ antiporter-2
MIRLAEPAYEGLTRLLPARWIAKLEGNKNERDEKDEKPSSELQQMYDACFKRFAFNMLINTVLCIAIMAIMYYYGQSIIASMVPEAWVHPVTAIIGLIICSPFLWMMMRAEADTPEVNKLWESGARWRVRITAYGLLRLIITAVVISYFVDYAIPGSTWLGIFAIVAIMVLIYFSSTLEKHSKKMTENFTENLNAREKNNEQ